MRINNLSIQNLPDLQLQISRWIIAAQTCLRFDYTLAIMRKQFVFLIIILGRYQPRIDSFLKYQLFNRPYFKR
jgi:hypothetical protein